MIENILTELEHELNVDIKNNVSIYIERETGKDKFYRNYAPEILFNHEAVYHPASLVKLFVCFAVKEMFSEKHDVENVFKKTTKLNEETISEIRIAIEQALRVSDNDALSYLVDLLTDTNSGLALEKKEYEIFKSRRLKITGFFFSRGFSANLNLPNKCFTFDYYGRDKQLYTDMQNQVDIFDVALIMKNIKKTSLDPNNKFDIYQYLRRNISLDNYEAKNFIGSALTEDDFYSKAGWNSKVRHDAAFITINDVEYLFIVMTKNLSHIKDLVSKVAAGVAKC